jgi:hypothetical protein
MDRTYSTNGKIRREYRISVINSHVSRYVSMHERIRIK